MKSIDEIKKIKKKAEADLLKIPGVTAVGVGRKKVGGKKTDEIAIIVYVKKKKKEKELPKKEVVPKKITEVTTDVVEGEFTLQTDFTPLADLQLLADSSTYDPLIGGISIGACRPRTITAGTSACYGEPPGDYVTAGTLGVFVIDNATGAEMMLSNYHVLAMDNDWSVGDPMVQPSRGDAGMCPGDVVGELQRISVGGQVDCAVASHTARGHTCDIKDIGSVTGQAEADIDMAVRKRGRKTGLTYGIVDSIDLTVNMDFCDGNGEQTLTGQIGIHPDTAINTQFSLDSDSGAVVVDDSNRIVGLIWAGYADGSYTAANPIQAVLDALNVSLCTEPPTIKVYDDYIVKRSADDFHFKPTNDFKHPASDFHTWKFADDHQKHKFLDDGKLKFNDEGGTDPRIDWYKSPALDKHPNADPWAQPPPDPRGVPRGGAPPMGPAPFILATPHHSLAFTGRPQAELREEAKKLQTELEERAEKLSEMHAAYEKLNNEEKRDFQKSYAEYQSLLGQFYQLSSVWPAAGRDEEESS